MSSQSTKSVYDEVFPKTPFSKYKDYVYVVLSNDYDESTRIKTHKDILSMFRINVCIRREVWDLIKEFSMIMNRKRLQIETFEIDQHKVGILDSLLSNHTIFFLDKVRHWNDTQVVYYKPCFTQLLRYEVLLHKLRNNMVITETIVKQKSIIRKGVAALRHLQNEQKRLNEELKIDKVKAKAKNTSTVSDDSYESNDYDLSNQATDVNESKGSEEVTEVTYEEYNQPIDKEEIDKVTTSNTPKKKQKITNTPNNSDNDTNDINDTNDTNDIDENIFTKNLAVVMHDTVVSASKSLAKSATIISNLINHSNVHKRKRIN
jgi:hypothetical protein